MGHARDSEGSNRESGRGHAARGLPRRQTRESVVTDELKEMHYRVTTGQFVLGGRGRIVASLKVDYCFDVHTSSHTRGGLGVTLVGLWVYTPPI